MASHALMRAGCRREGGDIPPDNICQTFADVMKHGRPEREIN